MNIGLYSSERLDYFYEPPFHPSSFYPEYPFTKISSSKNTVYDGIRKIFYYLELDKKNFDTPLWNPLGEIIQPGNSVVIKPNLVYGGQNKEDLILLITHPSIIRAVLDFVYIALKNEGTITIGDAPIQSTNFKKIITTSGLNKIIEYYSLKSDIKVSLIDFRNTCGKINNYGGFDRKSLDGDPLGYSSIDLGRSSEHFDAKKDYKKYRVTNYAPEFMLKHHNNNKHEYLISNSILNADVIINLPKLKTHRKAGMTCALKNLVGINGSKDWLPHHRIGSISEGGDEYLHTSIRKRILTLTAEKKDVSNNVFFLSLLTAIQKFVQTTVLVIPFKDNYFEGSWYGNDTIPRTIIDLNKILLYSDKTGKMQNSVQRKIFSIVDAVVAGEKEGPLHPDTKRCNILIAGDNSVAIDLVSSQIMGFDYLKIPTLKRALFCKDYPIFNEKVENLILKSDTIQNFTEISKKYNQKFRPPDGWKDHIEKDTE
jgi:uncharacterized protein (DUF362 family)